MMRRSAAICLLLLMTFVGIADVMSSPRPQKVSMSPQDRYSLLVQKLKPYIDAARWQEALTEAEQWREDFCDYPAYRELLRVLSVEDADVQPVPFPHAINTPDNEEYSPTVSADGRTLYFVRRGPHTGGSEDIYRSCKNEAGTWNTAQRVDALSSPTKHEAPTALSVDGTTMLMFSNGKLMMTQKTAYGWRSPLNLPESLQISTWQADAMLSSDGRALLFAAYAAADNDERPSLNIYVSLRDSMGHWGKPFSVGPAINTSGMERSPFLHPDMQTLYFCSDAHGTLGGLDVFVSTRLREDSWTEWSVPRNIGRTVNTTGDDCWYKISTDGTQAFYARKWHGEHDIYRMELPAAVRPRSVATIGGIIRDETGQIVHTTIRWEDMETGQSLGEAFSDPANGAYYVVLPLGKRYAYYVDDERYYPIAASIDLTQANTMVQVTENIELLSYRAMLEKGSSVTINNLFFDTNSAVIQPASLPELQRLARIILRNHFRVELCGHTDNTGSETWNLELSESRARTVRDYLVEQGCPLEDIRAVGAGAKYPCATNDTEEGRRLNRRVELRLLP